MWSVSETVTAQQQKGRDAEVTATRTESSSADFSIKWISRANTWLYKLNSGKLGGTFGKAPVALLITIGRKTGEPRVSPLLFL